MGGVIFMLSAPSIATINVVIHSGRIGSKSPEESDEPCKAVIEHAKHRAHKHRRPRRDSTRSSDRAAKLSAAFENVNPPSDGVLTVRPLLDPPQSHVVGAAQLTAVNCLPGFVYATREFILSHTARTIVRALAHRHANRVLLVPVALVHQERMCVGALAHAMKLLILVHTKGAAIRINVLAKRGLVRSHANECPFGFSSEWSLSDNSIWKPGFQRKPLGYQTCYLETRLPQETPFSALAGSPADQIKMMVPRGYLLCVLSGDRDYNCKLDQPEKCLKQNPQRLNQGLNASMPVTPASLGPFSGPRDAGSTRPALVGNYRTINYLLTASFIYVFGADFKNVSAMK
ncbi:hypothetical protein B0H12DRAFT_1067223 [Mycena haematopus]|nr:hypothetical protein B0H12DRAFT_1067223 [Mycena haematopus]